MSDIVNDLTDDLRIFIDFEVGAGRFKSSGEVIEAALLLLKERETRLAALRAAMVEAERADTVRRSRELR